MTTLYRSREWRELLNGLMAEQGMDLAYVAEYIGAPYNGSETVFYAKLPKKRRRFIGIGMALGQPLEVINQWIRDYSSQHMLYVKDLTEDLSWIYLIGLNAWKWEHRVEGEEIPNYFNMFDQCQEAVLMTYQQSWTESDMASLDAEELQNELEKISYDDTFAGLKQFIIDHIGSFKNAYARPRRILDRYLECILALQDGASGQKGTLDSLRGYLDDSMINYLSGDSETIHTMDRRRVDGKPIHMVRFKPVPKNRRTHINLCLALGMTRNEIDQYLQLMGYAPLRKDGKEGALSEALDKWEKTKPLQRAYKEACFRQMAEKTFDGTESLTPDQRKQAIQEMLNLRRDIQHVLKNI